MPPPTLMQRIQGARCWRYRCPTPSGTTLCRPRWSQAATSGAVHFVLFVHLRPCVPCQRIALPQTDLCVLPVTGSVRIAAVDGLNSLGSSGRRFLLCSCTTHGTSVVHGCVHTQYAHMYVYTYRDRSTPSTLSSFVRACRRPILYF